MTTFATTGSFVNNTDATFRAWALAVHDAMIGAGFIQTTDTGQMDFATVLKPTTTSTSAGYVMYRFADAMQATAPIFIKIEMGMGSTLDTSFGWRLAVANGTNGAGSVAAALFVQTGWTSQPITSYAGVNNTWGCHTAGAGWLLFYYESNSVGAMLGFAIFRTPDDAGVPSGEGCSIYFKTPTSQGGSVSLLRFIPTPTVILNQNVSNSPACFPFGLTDYKIGVDIQFFPHWSVAPKVRLMPYAFSYINADLTHASPITTTVIDGVSRVYLPIAGLSIIVSAFGGASSTTSTAFVWQ